MIKCLQTEKGNYLVACIEYENIFCAYYNAQGEFIRHCSITEWVWASTTWASSIQKVPFEITIEKPNQFITDSGIEFSDELKDELEGVVDLPSIEKTYPIPGCEYPAGSYTAYQNSVVDPEMEHAAKLVGRSVKHLLMQYKELVLTPNKILHGIK